MQINIKHILPHLAVMALFLILAAIYFSPQLQGKVLNQSDTANWEATSREARLYQDSTGHQAMWTNSIFSGMPTFQIAFSHPGNLLVKVDSVTKLFLSYPIGVFFAFMLFAYLALILIGVDYRIAAITAIGLAFSVYYLGLLKAGHNSKLNALVYGALVFSGMHLLFEQRKWVFGGVISALGLGLQITANHIQMTFYLMLAMGLFIIVQFIGHLRAKSLATFVKALGILIAGWAIGILTNSSQLLTSYEFGNQTMRGKPILQKSAMIDSTSSSTVDGLAWDYAMRWSNNGLDLMGTFFEGAAGGGNVRLNPTGELTAKLRQLGYTAPTFPLYFGGIDFTETPAYLGIVLWTLLIIGLFYGRPLNRYWLLAAIALIAVTSMGKYAAFFNKLMFDYFPLYNKFRAPSSAITIMTILVAIGAALGLQSVLSAHQHTPKTKKKELDNQLWQKALYTVSALFAVFLITGFVIDFSGSNDAQFAQANILEELRSERKMFYFKSLFKSLILAALVFTALFFYIRKKLTSNYLILILGFIVLFDLWSVGRHYLSKESFISQTNFRSQFTARPADEFILKDTDVHYRVHDVTSGDPFSSYFPSYFHKSIGGYSATKLQRYQDLIDGYLSKGHQGVFNMLNTKYFISPDENNQVQANVNFGALGNAWPVSSFIVVNTPNEEFNGLNGLNPAEMAIVHQDFKSYLDGLSLTKAGTIKLTKYSPNELTYSADLPSEQLIVFSEVWYGPHLGWQAYLDGQPVEHIRANYILRAMRIPAGQHTVEFKFEPKSFKNGTIISLLFSTLILLGTIGVILFPLYEKYRTVNIRKPH